MEHSFPLLVAALHIEIVWSYGFIGAILGGIASAVVGGLLSGSSARSTNRSNQAIATQETEFNQASAREANTLTRELAGNANALTDKLSLRATKSTEGMTASAIALSKSQFDQTQAFNERMSNTAYTRGIADLKAAGLNPILAATRGQTSSPTVSGGPTASGSGTGGSGTSGSGTSARASQFRKIDAGLQALNSAAAVGRVEQEIEAMRLANQARKKFGHGTLADKAETIAKTSTSIKKRVKSHFLRPAAGASAKLIGVTKQKLKSEWKTLKSEAKKAGAARGPRSIYQLFGPPSRRRN